jgi:hypothetical protein
MAFTKIAAAGIGSTGTVTLENLVVTGSITASLTGTATTTTNIPNLTGAITSNNTTTSLGSFSSANLATALSDKTGSGAAVFATSPVLVTPSLGIAIATSINASGIITATQLSTGASGTGVNITTDTISGPATLTIDPAAVGDNTGAVRIKGDLYVDGTQFIVNSTTIELADFRIGIGTTATSDELLNGAGIGIGSASNQKTLTWNNNSTALKSSEDFDVASGKVYKIAGTSVLSNNTLGSGILTSSLTSVGTLGSLSVGNVNSTGIITATTFVGALTGTASSVTTNANLTGDVTSIGNATAIASDVIIDADIKSDAAIAVSKLAASTISGVTLGNNLNTLSISTGLSGSSYNGSGAVTIAIDSTVATLTGIQTLTNKTLTSPTLQTPILGTPQSGTLTSCTGLPISGLTASTSTALGVGSIELGHASDTTIARSDAGVVTIEGVEVVTLSRSQTLTNKTLTAPSLGAATATSIVVGSGVTINASGINASAGIITAANYSVTTASSTQASGATIQRVFTKSVAAGELYQLATYQNDEGSVAFDVQVSSHQPGNSGTSTYRFQGGYSQLTGSYYRLYPFNDGRGHGDSADTGLDSNAWNVFIYGTTVTGSDYTYGVAVHVPTGRTGKSLITTITELKRGMTFSDQSATAVITSFTNSGIIYSHRNLIVENRIGVGKVPATAIDVNGTVTATAFSGALTGTASNVTTNANLTGHVTSVGNAAVLGSFTSANLSAALTDETGTGSAVFATNPTFSTSVGIGTIIDIIPYDTLNSGTLSFEASAGQLFSITNNLTSGSIFSVNDVSGIPSIDVNANGTILLGAYGGNIGIGTINPTAKLDIGGGLAYNAGTYQAPLVSVSGGYLSIKSQTADGVARLTLIGDSATGDGTIDWGGNGNFNLKFTNNGNERARFDGSGNFGINDTSPSTRVTGFSVRGTDSRYFTVSKVTGQPIWRFDDNSVGSALLQNFGMTAANHGMGIQFQLGDTVANSVVGGSIYCLSEQTWTSTASTKDSYLRFDTTLDGVSTERMRINAIGAIIKNQATREYNYSGYAYNNQVITIDVPVVNDEGSGCGHKIWANHTHYNWSSYGALLECWVSSRGTDILEQLNTHNITSGNGGAWTVTKPNTTTLRISKSAGSYTGTGYYWVRVITNHF